jgi:hypothetical protein
VRQNPCRDKSAVSGCICAAAADEIERLSAVVISLQVERRHLKAEIERWEEEEARALTGREVEPPGTHPDPDAPPEGYAKADEAE